MIKTVTADTVSLERIREFLQAAELLADNELDMIFPDAEWSVYAEGIRRDLVALLFMRESFRVTLTDSPSGVALAMLGAAGFALGWW